MAELIVLSPQHLPVPVADREHLLEGVDDRSVGQGVAGLANEVLSEEHGVLEMDDIGSVGEQELAKMPRV